MQSQDSKYAAKYRLLTSASASDSGSETSGTQPEADFDAASTISQIKEIHAGCAVAVDDGSDLTDWPEGDDEIYSWETDEESMGEVKSVRTASTGMWTALDYFFSDKHFYSEDGQSYHTALCDILPVDEGQREATKVGRADAFTSGKAPKRHSHKPLLRKPLYVPFRRVILRRWAAAGWFTGNEIHFANEDDEGLKAVHRNDGITLSNLMKWFCRS